MMRLFFTMVLVFVAVMYLAEIVARMEAMCLAMPGCVYPVKGDAKPATEEHKE